MENQCEPIRRELDRNVLAGIAQVNLPVSARGTRETLNQSYFQSSKKLRVMELWTC